MSRERIVRVGSGSLVGVLTEPESALNSERPGFLILNAGVLHRVGPARLHVALARRLADAGFASLRFDFSGIGDSEPRRDGMPFDDRAVVEVRDAMDHMARTRSVRRFVLFGLCSGADVAFLATKADMRVAGHVSLDGLAYRTLGYYAHYYGRRLLKARSWIGFVQRHVRGGLHRLAAPLGGGAKRTPQRSLFVRQFPPRDRAVADLSAFAERGVQQFFVYSGGHERWFNHAGQFERMFHDVAFRGRVRTRYFPAADHTFPDLRQQDALITEVVRWAAESWPAPEAGTAPAQGSRAGAVPAAAAARQGA